MRVTNSKDKLKFIHSEKATKFYEISTVDLSYIVPVKSTVHSGYFYYIDGYKK